MMSTARATAPPLLAGVDEPDRLRSMQPAELRLLAGEIRRVLVERVCRASGHLGSNLGVVELTLALHRVFDSPGDVLLFDTGHQAYVHKMVTGRADQFSGLRQRGGLSGYPSRDESPHDVIENSHASTALSYADGIARARVLAGDDRWVVALVGDGALTGGMVDILAREPDADVLLIAAGVLAGTCLGVARRLAAQGIRATVIDPRWVFPVPAAVVDLARLHRLVVTLEDGVSAAGVGTAVSQALAEAGVRTPVRHLGLPRRFLEHGRRDDILAAARLDEAGIAAAVAAARAPDRSPDVVQPAR